MAKLLKLRRGTTSQHSTFTGAEGECTVYLDKDVLVVHDGSTQAGHPLAAEDLSNVSSATIVGRLNAASIPTVNIASGALPTGVTITTDNIVNLTVATADIANDAVNQDKIADDAVGADQLASDSVVSASIVDGSIVNADVNASAAIAGTKISPDFGSQNVDTTGNILLDSDSSKLKIGDGEDLEIFHNGSENIINIAGASHPFEIKHGSERLAQFNPNGTVGLYHDNSLKINTAGAGINVTGNIEVSGTVDGVDIAAIGVAGGVIASGTTATTQSASDNSTKVATTAYVETAISNLVDSAPGTLNTLNELAAALGDDASFSTTVTNSIATKMPLAGGTFTGDVTFDGATAGKDVFFDRSANAFEFQDGAACRFGNSNDLAIYHDGSNSIINESGTGNLQITSGTNIHLRKDDGAGNLAQLAEFNVDSDVELYHAGTKMFETMTNGFKSTDRIYADGGVIGRDATDLFNFINNDRIEVYINDSQEFRMTSGGDFHADGDVIAFSTTISSDEKLKENIEVVPDALDKIEALRGVTFDWKRDGKSSAGVIAQEVMGVLPEAVKEVQGLNDNESHLTVNYHALTSILIEAIKDLSAKVKELEAK